MRLNQNNVLWWQRQMLGVLLVSVERASLAAHYGTLLCLEENFWDDVGSSLWPLRGREHCLCECLCQAERLTLNTAHSLLAEQFRSETVFSRTGIHLGMPFRIDKDQNTSSGKCTLWIYIVLETEPVPLLSSVNCDFSGFSQGKVMVISME